MPRVSRFDGTPRFTQRPTTVPPPRPCALGDRRAQAADEVTVGFITLTIGVAGDLIGNAGVRTADQGPQMRPEPPSAEIF